MRDTRTTCAVEAYNGVLGKKIVAKATFFKFVEAIQCEELAKSIEFRQHIDSGGASTSTEKNKYAVSDNFLLYTLLRFPNKIMYS